MLPNVWTRLDRLARLVLRLAQCWKTKRDLDLDLPSTDIDLEFGTGEDNDSQTENLFIAFYIHLSSHSYNWTDHAQRGEV